MKNYHGFSFIEVMFVAAIIAILVAIALPSYEQQTQKTRRADAVAVLSGFAVAMERYYTTQSPPSYINATAASGGVGPGKPKGNLFPSSVPVNGSSTFYDLKVKSASASAFEIQAIPVNQQANDPCGTLIYRSTGVKAISGAVKGMTWKDCWE